MVKGNEQFAANTDFVLHNVSDKVRECVKAGNNNILFTMLQEIKTNPRIFTTIVIGFGSKRSTLNEKVTNIEKSKYQHATSCL